MNEFEELGLEPLKVKCTDSDCENNLHCFLTTKKMVREGRAGRCRECDARLVDWDRVHKRDITDFAFTYNSLQFELIRHHFWHVHIDQKAINHARRKGFNGMRSAAIKRIKSSIASAFPIRDGQQTPFEGNVLYYAQHATATCCRRCLEEWHDIPKGISLLDEQVEYCVELVMKFVEQRFPDLTEDGEYVPRMR